MTPESKTAPPTVPNECCTCGPGTLRPLSGLILEDGTTIPVSSLMHPTAPGPRFGAARREYAHKGRAARLRQRAANVP